MKRFTALLSLIVLASLAPLSAQTLADGAVHTAKIDYEPGTLEVFIDDLDTPVLTVSVDLTSLNLGDAWIGFTSGTGTFDPIVDVVSWSFTNGLTDFSFEDFASVEGIRMVGFAAQAGDRLRLIDASSPPDRYETAAAWASSRHQIGDGFSTTFEFQLIPDPGAGGIVLVIQDFTASALGGCGYGLGYLDGDNAAGRCDFYGDPGTILSAIAIEFDTYANSSWPPEYIDGGSLLGGILRGNDHVAVISTPPGSPPASIFSDGFESGDASRWNVEVGYDDHGNDASRATLVDVPSLTNGDIEVADDLDWFQMDLKGGTEYIFETNLGSLPDSVLAIYDTDGVTLLIEDDDSGTGFASRIEWVPPAFGRYFVEVTGFDSGDIGTYSLSVGPK